jgi:hypothetical protein
MDAKPVSDPIIALRDTIAAIDREPGMHPPSLAALRKLLEDRLHRLEAESQSEGLFGQDQVENR